MLIVVLLVGALVSYLLFTIIKRTDCSLVLALAEKFGTSPEKHFNDKVVWVIGASSGIGEDIVYQLVKCNCKIILSARRLELLRNVKIAALEKSWTMSEQDICILPLDQTDFDALGSHVEKANKVFDRPVDIVILNAGQSQRSDWATIEREVDLACFNLNALGPTVLTRKLLPSMLARKSGQFVVVSSLAGVFGVPLSASYSAAKHALNGYFRSLALDHCHDGIDVTIACPGLTYAPNNPKTAFTNTSGQGLRNDIESRLFLRTVAIDVTIACPGLTYAPNNPKIAFTNTSGRAHGQVLTGITAAHMTSERAAQLICTAAANRLTEVWFSTTKMPLALGYASFLVPDLVKRLVLLLGAERLKKMRAGNSNIGR